MIQAMNSNVIVNLIYDKEIRSSFTGMVIYDNTILTLK